LYIITVGITQTTTMSNLNIENGRSIYRWESGNQRILYSSKRPGCYMDDGDVNHWSGLPKIHINNKTFTGNNVTIIGSNNIVHGHHITIIGHNNILNGKNFTIIGRGNAMNTYNSVNSFFHSRM
jgi:acetyltransferase-like isoleucine patch superfamily enzyme